VPREPRDLARGAYVSHDEVPAPIDRQVGKADRQVPAFLPHPLVADVEDLGGLSVGARERVDDDRDVPGDAVVDVPTEKAG
jgi:hypothetical protein